MNPITIVMYHYVRPSSNSNFPGIKGLELEGFKRQLDYLDEHFNIVTTEQVVAACLKAAKLPTNACWLTFDDGYKDRFCMYMPGWEMPKNSSDLLTDNYGFITDYLAEAFHYQLKHTNRYEEGSFISCGEPVLHYTSLCIWYPLPLDGFLHRGCLGVGSDLGSTYRQALQAKSTCIVYKSHHCETTENLRYLRTEYRQR